MRGIDRASLTKKDGVKNDFFSLQALAKNRMLFINACIGAQAVYLHSSLTLLFSSSCSSQKPPSRGLGKKQSSLPYTRRGQ